MQSKNTSPLFRHGLAPEVKLFFLTVLCFALLTTDSNWRILEPIRSATSTVLYPFQQVALWPRNVFAKIYNWSHAISLSEQQQVLAEQQKIENARLAMNASQLSGENIQLRRLLGVKEAVSALSTAVEVLYTPANSVNQSVVLNKGSNEHIAPGMPVIGEGGIVGQIRRVSANTSEASLITDEQISIPAMIQRNGLRVIVFGSGTPNNVEVRYLSNEVDIKVGDFLVSSGIGGYYPAGLAIGHVKAIETNTAEGFVLAKVEPSAHPDRYRHFLVLLETPEGDTEQGLLEGNTQIKEQPSAKLPNKRN